MLEIPYFFFHKKQEGCHGGAGRTARQVMWHRYLQDRTLKCVQIQHFADSQARDRSVFSVQQTHMLCSKQGEKMCPAFCLCYTGSHSLPSPRALPPSCKVPACTEGNRSGW